MTISAHHVRAFGANVRTSLLTYYTNRDNDAGYRVCRRAALEAMRLVGEAHGEDVAYEMLVGLAERHVGLPNVDDAWDLPPFITDALEAEAEEDAEDQVLHKPPQVFVPGLGDAPVTYRNLTHAEAAALVKAAHDAMTAATRLEWPTWRRMLHRYAPPAWFLAFVIGMVCAR